MLLPIKDIRLDGCTQIRHALDQAVVEEYAQAICDGKNLPHVHIFGIGGEYFLADGFHRVSAHLKAGKAEINCDMHRGSLRDAVLFSIDINQRHGLRLSIEDRRKAALMLLEDKEWSAWTDSEIGRRVGMSPKTISNMRVSHRQILSENGSSHRQIQSDGASECPDSSGNVRVYVNKHGQKAKMDVSKIGRKPPAFAWKPFYEAFGSLYRKVSLATDEFKSHPGAAPVKDQLSRWKELFKTWYSEVSGKEPEPEISEKGGKK